MYLSFVCVHVYACSFVYKHLHAHMYACGSQRTTSFLKCCLPYFFETGSCAGLKLANQSGLAGQ